MVVGTGMIGARFKLYIRQEEFVVFASGVSNSRCTSNQAYKREFDLLKKNIEENRDKIFIYFSTCSILDEEQKTAPYVLHKLEMEAWIEANAPRYVIFRISNPIGRTDNTHTFFNFFIKQIVGRRPFEVWKFAARNILDIDDMYLICDYILQHRLFMNQIVNVANITNYSVLDIIEAIERHYQVKGAYRVINKGNGPLIATGDIHPIINRLQIDFSHNYIERILNKYF